MKCLDKKRIKMKQGETLALNERIMLSLVSTGVSIQFWTLHLCVCVCFAIYLVGFFFFFLYQDNLFKIQLFFPLVNYAASQFLRGLEFIAGSSSTKLI